VATDRLGPPPTCSAGIRCPCVSLSTGVCHSDAIQAQGHAAASRVEGVSGFVESVTAVAVLWPCGGMPGVSSVWTPLTGMLPSPCLGRSPSAPCSVSVVGRMLSDQYNPSPSRNQAFMSATGRHAGPCQQTLSVVQWLPKRGASHAPSPYGSVLCYSRTRGGCPFLQRSRVFGQINTRVTSIVRG
jgi:hypothetical protein